MTEYVITSDGELYHYGVKGMKWGVRRAEKKQARAERKQMKRNEKYSPKIEKRYAKAGRYEGASKYNRDRADAITSQGEKNARALEKASKQYQAEGKNARAVASKLAANAARNTAADKAADYEYNAAYYANKASKSKEKASAYATKKRVDVGKSQVNSILKSSGKQGYERAKTSDEFWQEEAKRQAMGDTGYAVYDTLRDRR